MKSIPKILLVAIAPLFILALFPFQVLESLFLAGETLAVRWYGLNFESKVANAVNRVAEERPYCVFDDNEDLWLPSAKELDKEKIIKRAYADRLPIPRTVFRDPHFRLLVDKKTYWWSFEQVGFVLVRNPNWQLDLEKFDRMCRNYHYRRFPADPRWQRSGRLLKRANFCCPHLHDARYSASTSDAGAVGKTNLSTPIALATIALPN